MDLQRINFHISAQRIYTSCECPLPQIRVLNPMTHNTWDEGRYTTYEICMQTHHKAFSLTHSAVRRRFSEFSWLRKQLKNHHTVRTPPELPPKKYFIQRFDDEFIQKRREGLEKFLNSVIQEKLYLSDSVLHLFIQTNLSCEEMSDFIDGKLSEDFIQELWASGGKKKVESPESVHQSSYRLSVSSTDQDDSLQSDILSGSLVSNESELSLLHQNDSTSDASSSTGQSDQEESLSKGDNSIDSGVNVSQILEDSKDSIPELKRMVSGNFHPSSEFSINMINQVEDSSEG